MEIVETVEFSSPDPADHTCRVLDVARRMGFRFVSIRVEPKMSGLFKRRRSGAFEITFSFCVAGHLSLETFMKRVLSFDGVDNVARVRALPELWQ